MTTGTLISILAFMTIGAALTAAWISKRQTEKRLNDPSAPKSTLAKDGPGPNPATTPRGDDIDPTGGGVTPQGDRA